MADAATRSAMDPAAGRWRRVRVGVGTQVRAFVRSPTDVALLVVLPVVVVEGYGAAMSAFPQLPFVDVASMTRLGRINGAVFAVAVFAAVLGLFQVIGALQADRRLRLAGYARAELFAARLATVALGSLVVSAAALAVLARTVDPAAPLVAYGALLVAALIYGLIGMLVGAALPRPLEGSLLVVFVVDFDDFLSSGILDVEADVLRLLPLHYPHELLRDAVLSGSVATGDAVAGVAYLLAVLAVVLVLYVRLTGGGGGR